MFFTFRVKWFFLELFTEKFFKEPKMVLLWHHCNCSPVLVIKFKYTSKFLIYICTIQIYSHSKPQQMQKEAIGSYIIITLLWCIRGSHQSMHTHTHTHTHTRLCVFMLHCGDQMDSRTWHFWHCGNLPVVPLREKKILQIVNYVYLKV